MISIGEINLVLEQNPNLSILEVLEVLQAKYDMTEKEIASFVKSNKTLFSKLQIECARHGKIKLPEHTNLEKIL